MSAPSLPPMVLSPHSLLDPPRPDPPTTRSGATSPDEDEIAASPSSVREVMACLDGSEFGRGVVPHAQLIAKALGARLTLLRVLESEADESRGTTPADPLEWGIRRREARAQLDGIAAELAGTNANLRAELIQGRPAEQICGWAEQHDIDLTVLCSHGARGLTEWSLASTARKLIDHLSGSVLLVPAAVAARSEEVRYRRILVPLDGSPRAESVVPLAMRIAASERAEVLFVHVVPEPEIIRMGPHDAEGAELERRVVEHNQRVANEYLDRVRARVSHGAASVRGLVVGSGKVRSTLGRLIREERVDLVVMSAHGQTGRNDTTCGSVAEHALMHATTPLLVVRDRASQRMRRVGRSTGRSHERHGPVGHSTL